LVNNGTFESGVSGWFTWNGGTLQATTTRFHGGAQSLVVTNRTSNAPAAVDLSAIAKSGAAYPMSVWVSIDSPDGTSKKINVTRKAVCTNADGTTETTYSWVGSQVTVPDDASWTEIKGTLSLPTCNVTQLQLFVEGDAGADLYVDDVSVTDPSLSNILPDGTFENGIGAWGTWGGATLSTTTTLNHSGNQAAVLTNRTSNAPIARSLTSLVTAGKSYQIVFWASIDSPDNASASVNITAKTQCSGADASYAWLVNPVAIGDRTWAKLAGTLNVPDCALADVMVYAEGPGAGIDLYVDDVSLSPL
ncbi:MAG TPA: carbohydrate binding domain-containing protein, partial [Polyangiaceae bacterium]